ncbi:mechanosensitive ion channel family protein [Stieleria sp. ICT_E10.1]|uniref:mechanosensitive ion channel family protein n=1 Tax=Stieleria sedimenti TaxID=2976331 RepID=UPI002180168C|nr:mechanosensitive ion channel family protein [Stieleria sedimenti]MCS7468098.1 mechanosensitive ion channel family protein [Stieleria sedimenti]
MFFSRSVLVAIAMLASCPIPLLAQSGGDSGSDSGSDSSLPAVRISDPQIPIDQLQIKVKPMTKSELQREADAWFALLRAKGGQIAEARLGVKQVISDLETTAAEATEAAGATTGSEAADGAAEVEVAEVGAAEVEAAEVAAAEVEMAEAKQGLLADVNVLQDERTALSDRLEVVLDSLELKGGEAEEYRSYLAAVSGIELDTSDVQTAWSGFVGWLMSREGGQRWAWNLARFVAILVITSIIARIIAKIVNWLLDRKVKISQLAERMISNSIKNVVFVIGFAVALTALEIDITPIVAAIGATGLVVGLALQGTLSNFASGLMILVNRPFDVGNVVTAGGITGTVDKMNLISTTFRTFDNQTIHVPNNSIWNNVITNITANENRRVDMEFGIGYGDDFEQAEQIILEVVKSHDLVLEDPAPVVVTHALADSSVNIVCRPWAKTGDWWQVKTDVTRAVKRRFDEAGISIPFPQRDVYVHQVDAAKK